MLSNYFKCELDSNRYKPWSSPNPVLLKNVAGMSTKVCKKVLLCGGKTWRIMTKDVQQLVTADSGIIRWISGVSLKDHIPMTDLLLHLGMATASWNAVHRHPRALKIKVSNHRILSWLFSIEQQLCNTKLFKYPPLGIPLGIVFFIFTNKTKCSIV